MAQSERWKEVKAWGSRELHSGNVSPNRAGFERIPLHRGMENGQERECSWCVHVHMRKVTQRSPSNA